MSKFDLGQTVITATARDTYAPEFVLACLRRHAAGDWGDLDPEDAAANDAALVPGQESRLLSSYAAPDGGKLWVITEWDRSVTTVLLPSDY